MKQIVVLSGKGGTGKTTVTAALAHLASENPSTRAILVDADVDAANLELLLAPHIIETHEFVGGQVAVFAADLCSGCGLCADVCRFDAVRADNGLYTVDTIACEGCATCKTQCPSHAITMLPQISGRWFFSTSRYGPLFHARLSPAQESSGKLVTLLKQRAFAQALDESYPLMIVDGPPGIGCPAIAAVSGADMVIVVTEPTAAGIHDMQRVLDLAAHFGIPALVCVNKADLYPAGTDRITGYCQQNELPVIGRLPFDLSITEAMVRGQTITEYLPDSPISRALREIWQGVLAYIHEKAAVR
jgi:MinD superfamily P-loop ATPase